MRIVKVPFNSYEGIIREFGKIGSNERGALVNPELFEISDEIDFGDKNLVLGEVDLDMAEKFIGYCGENGKKPCFIFFNTRINLELLEKLGEKINLREDLMLVGARNLGPGEISFLARNKVKQVGLNQLEIDLENVTDSVMEFSSGKELVLEFDFSVLDLFEPTGLSGRKAVYILGRVGMMKNLRIACLSGKATSEQETQLGARLLAELV